MRRIQNSSQQRALQPHPAGSTLIVIGCCLAIFMAQGDTASGIARFYSYSIGLGIAASLLFDLKRGVRNLIRADIICISSLFFLTLFEFLFDQEKFDLLQTPESILPGLQAVALAFCSFSIARHFIKPSQKLPNTLRFQEVNIQKIVYCLYLAAALGYFNQLLSVNFNPVAFIEAYLGPRFAVPWTRSKIGGWGSLISELGLLIYTIPPLTGVLWHQFSRVSNTHKILVCALFLLTLFTGFCSGTRNILAAYIAGFLGAYLLTHPRPNLKTIIAPCVVALVVFTIAQFYMLSFRNIGLETFLARNEVKKEVLVKSETKKSAKKEIFVDYNLHAITELTEAFPQDYDYLGMEMVTHAITKPVPRAFWPGKPVELSVSIEEAMNATGLTIAATYIGESYMAAGSLGVVLGSLFFAMIAAWWNRLGSLVDSTFSLLVFASGFYPLLLSMRSMLWFTTAALPTLALIVIYHIWLKKQH